MSPQELHLLLPLLKAETIDLRNNMADSEALGALGHPTQVKAFKLSGINNPSYQSILKTVSKMIALAHLSFTNFSSAAHSPFDLLEKMRLRNGERPCN
jgi:hypothetical protein